MLSILALPILERDAALVLFAFLFLQFVFLQLDLSRLFNVQLKLIYPQSSFSVRLKKKIPVGILKASS